MLRTLPTDAQQRVPLRLRHRVVVTGMVIVVAAVAAAVIAFLVPRTHHGAPPLPQPAPKQTPHAVTLCNSCAHDYNPDALSGAKNQHPNTVSLAIDGDRNATWTTEVYFNNNLGNPGVGLYVDAKPGVAAGSLILDTATPGYAVSSMPATPPLTQPFDRSWVKVGAPATCTGPRRSRLPPGARGTGTTWCGSRAWATTTRWRSTTSRCIASIAHQVRSGSCGAAPATMAAAALSIGRAWAAKASRLRQPIQGNQRASRASPGAA